MEENKFNFRINRAPADVVQATFSFLSQEFKPLIILLAKYALPFVIISALGSYYYQTEMIESISDDPYSFSGSTSVFTAGYFMSTFLGLIGQLAILLVTYAFIKQYIAKDESLFAPTAKNLIVPFIVGGFVTTILTVIGSMFLLLPGIYFMVTFTLIWSIMTFEEKSFSDAFSRCFTIIKNNWWGTFGLIILLAIITIIITLMLSVPLMLGGAYSGFLGGSEGFASDSLLVTAWSTIITIIGAIIYVLFYIAFAIQYFSIIERTEAPTLNDKIDQI